jgi:moderate conductance mechanosensitive channel
MQTVPKELSIWSRVLETWKQDCTQWLGHDLPRLVINFVAIAIVASILIRLLRVVTRRLDILSKRSSLPTGMRAQQLRTLASVIYSVGLALIIFVAAMDLLYKGFGINVEPLLASAGIVGLAIGFGAQTLVKDVLNGFFILFENHYDVGDVVKIAGVGGSVESMTLRRTTLRDSDGTVYIVPNSEIHVVSNLTRDWSQLALTVSVDYSENSDHVVDLLKTIASEVYEDPEFSKLLVAKPEVPGIERVTGREVDYLLLAKCKPGQQYPISRELRRRIKACFEKNNIKAGSPTMVYVGETNKAS